MTGTHKITQCLCCFRERYGLSLVVLSVVHIVLALGVWCSG